MSTAREVHADEILVDFSKLFYLAQSENGTNLLCIIANWMMNI